MRVFLATFFLFSLLNGLTAQDQKILEIQKIYKETQQNKESYTQLIHDDFENSSEGAKVTSFKNDDEIRLIETVYYGHLGKNQYEYYLADDQLYFVIVANYRYNAPPTEPEYDFTKTTKEECRYYFWDKNMIRCVKPDGTFLQPGSDEFNEQKQRILELAIMTIEELK